MFYKSTNVSHSQYSYESMDECVYTLDIIRTDNVARVFLSTTDNGFALVLGKFDLGLSDDDINKKFGFFVEALKYGTPPHMGMGLGLERIIMLLANTDNIRDVVAFPKIQSAADMMNDAPSFVNEADLTLLGIQVTNTEE